MAITTQELETIADKLVKNTKIHKSDNISTLGYQELRNLFGGDLPEKIRLNGIEQDKFNQQASLLKIKIFVLYKLLQKTKESKYYSQIDNLIRQLNQQQLGIAIREERIRFQRLLEDAKKISGGNSGKPVNKAFLHPQQNQHKYQIPPKREQFHKQEQQYEYDSLEQINAKIQDLQKEQDLQKQILLKKYNNLILRRPGSQQYPRYNQFLLASYNKEIEEYENLRKKFEERNRFIAYYKKKYAAKAALSGIQHTQLVIPARQIAVQQQALENARIEQRRLAEQQIAAQQKLALENARIAQQLAEQQAKQARERQIAAQQQALEKARIEQKRLAEQQIAAQQKLALENARIARQLAEQQAKEARERQIAAQQQALEKARIEQKRLAEQQIRIQGNTKEISFTTPKNNPNITISYKYFTPEQENAIKEYFRKNPNAKKIKRSLDRKGKTRKSKSVGVISEYPIENLPYSVIKTEQGQIFVVTGEILGKGGMSVVKVAEHLDQNLQPTGNIVAAKIQGSTKHNEAYRDRKSGGHSLIPKIKSTRDEESILAILGEFLGHASNNFLCKLGLTKNQYDKQYTFLKLKKGQTVYKCFQDNKNSLKTNQAGQLKIFLAILQATKKLHDHKIIHGDLNFNNFMINDEGQVEVIDYGMAGKANERGLIQNDNASMWVAPEARISGTHNFKSDIYTLGWWMQAMLEHVATSSPLRSNLKFKQLLGEMTYYNRARSNSHQSRPTIDECINRMSSILEQEEKKLPRNIRGRFSGMDAGG